MLPCYLSWYLKQALAPILCHDHDEPAAAAQRRNPVVAAQRFNPALAKASRKRTADHYPAQLHRLLADLATVCANHVQPTHDMPAFTMITTPTPLQRWAVELLGVSRRTAWRSQYTHTTRPQLNTQPVTKQGTSG